MLSLKLDSVPIKEEYSFKEDVTYGVLSVFYFLEGDLAPEN